AVEDINGKVLGELNRETVKELGVKQIGRQLALLKMIKKRTQEQQASSLSPSAVMKEKITLKDKATWTAAQKTSYNIKEPKKLRPENKKIYLKTSERKKPQLEELCTKLAQYCAIPEIGFGYGLLPSKAIMQLTTSDTTCEYLVKGHWFHILLLKSDHKPAKRARISPKTSFLSQNMSTSDSDTEEISDSQTSTDEPSSSVADISPKSAKIAVVTAFQGNCLQDLTLKAHIILLAKKLGVRHRSKGKYELIEPLAKELFNQGYVKSQDDGDVNFKS
ncbi:unnamed protein product, partial [Porites evermanni]